VQAAGVLLGSAVLLFAGLVGEARAEFVVNIQGAGAFTGYNDVRIPGKGGTDISFSDDLAADAALSGRVEIGYLVGTRTYVGIMASPLRVDSHGSVDHEVDFAGTSFPAGTQLDGTFRFDSYRLTWRYKFSPWQSFDLWLGLTAKIRDAGITLEGGGLRAEKTNTGVVPLINFLAEWRIAPPWSLRLAGDALGVSQGRAEDVLLAIVRDLGASTKLFAGYRILEGGADNDEVYTFSLFHYLVAGVEARF
jgi:hypothetical protein